MYGSILNIVLYLEKNPSIIPPKGFEIIFWEEFKA